MLNEYVRQSGGGRPAGDWQPYTQSSKVDTAVTEQPKRSIHLAMPRRVAGVTTPAPVSEKTMNARVRERSRRSRFRQTLSFCGSKERPSV